MPFKIEQLVGIGILTIIIGFLLVFFGVLFGAKDSSTNSKITVGGFIGFIPFGFGNDKKLVWFIAILSLAVFLLWFFFSSRIFK